MSEAAFIASRAVKAIDHITRHGGDPYHEKMHLLSEAERGVPSPVQVRAMARAHMEFRAGFAACEAENG